MMKFDKIFICSAIALSMCNCSDDKDPVDVITPTPGKEVVFGASLDNNASRTIYGPEEGNKFPILWENGDSVSVYSPQGTVTEAIYTVNVPGTGQAYANSLDKVTDAGIQWGTEPTADFYSVYPAKQVQAYDNTAKKVTVRLPHMQNDYISLDAASGKYTAHADMKGGFLFAQNIGVENGTKPVTLGYKPISTALRFTLNGPSSTTGGAANLDTVIISDIVITAPASVTLAGNFDINFPTEENANPTYTVAAPDNEDTFNHVTVYSSYDGNKGGGFITLLRGESIELNAFIIPQENVSITDEWTITVTLSNGTKLSKKLGAAAGTAGTATTLKPGQIHRLPALPALDIPTSTKYDPSNWMVNIPRNTYLSEISLPGSWNSMGDAQKINGSVTSLANQYNAGVRAFHLDTRWQGSRSSIFSSYSITNLGVANGGDTYNFVMTNSNNSTTGRIMTGSSNPTFATALTQVTDRVSAEEYMVILCTFAQGSAEKSGTTWMQAISDVCAENDKVYDGSTITPNTVVGDVLGKVIVIVCLEDAVDGLTLPTGSKCLFTHAPLTLSASMFASGATYQKDQLVYGSKDTSGITLFNTQAQICSQTTGETNSDRGYAPSLAQRQTIGNNILTWSNSNYGNANYAHSDWVYLGIGGYYKIGSTDNYTDVATSMNAWINGKIINMSPRPTGTQTNYYPVGIVLMNQVANYTGVIDNILQLNNKFQKAFNPDWTGTVDPVGPTPTRYQSSMKVDTNGWNVF